MSEVVAVIALASGDHVTFWCPGCDERHAVEIRPGMWTWNGSHDKPTFTPSVLVNRGALNPAHPVCHSFVTSGEIRYLSDCTHDLAGQTVPLPPI